MIVLKNGTVVDRTEVEDKYRFTFPVVEAQLDREHIDNFGLLEGLANFARKLASQYEDVEGVQIHSIGVTFLRKKD